MPESEKSREVMRTMPCASTDKTLAELKKEGWEDAWSFHTRFTDQWNDACDRVTELQERGFDVVLVKGQDRAEREDGVAYIYKKRAGV